MPRPKAAPPGLGVARYVCADMAFPSHPDPTRSGPGTVVRIGPIDLIVIPQHSVLKMIDPKKYARRLVRMRRALHVGVAKTPHGLAPIAIPTSGCWNGTTPGPPSSMRVLGEVVVFRLDTALIAFKRGEDGYWRALRLSPLRSLRA